MNGKLEPEERVMDPPSIAEQISKVIEKLDWQCQDNIVVEIGGRT